MRPPPLQIAEELSIDSAQAHPHKTGTSQPAGEQSRLSFEINAVRRFRGSVPSGKGGGL
jgi:hypothetical protein